MYIIQDIKSWLSIEEHSLTTPLQFVIYAQALAEMKSCDIDKIKCQYDLPLANAICDAGTNGFIKRGTNKIKKLFDGIDAEDFKPTASELCHWCEFCKTNDSAKPETKYLCPYHCIWTRERPIYLNYTKFTNLEDYPTILEAYQKKIDLTN